MTLESFLKYFTRQRLLLLSNLIPLVLLVLDQKPLYFLLWVYGAELLAVIFWSFIRFIAGQGWAFKGDGNQFGELLVWIFTTFIPGYVLGIALIMLPTGYFAMISFLTAGAQGVISNTITDKDIVLAGFSFGGSLFGFWLSHGIQFIQAVRDKKVSDIPPFFHLLTPLFYCFPLLVVGACIGIILAVLTETLEFYPLPLTMPQFYLVGSVILAIAGVYFDFRRDIYERKGFLSKDSKFLKATPIE